MGKSRFTISEEPSEEFFDEDLKQLKKHRISSIEEDRKGRIKITRSQIAVISAVLLIVVLAVLILTGHLFKKPFFFGSGNKVMPQDLELSDAEKKGIPDTKTENIHLVRGKESYFKGYFNDAITEFSEVLDSDASDSDKAIALTYIGIIFDDRGDYNKAIEHYLRALKYDENNPLIYRNLSIAYRHTGEYQKARDAIKRSLSIKPEDINNRILSGNIFYEQENYEEAKKEYQEALKTNPESPSAMYNLAQSLLKLGDIVPAMEYLKKAGELDKMGRIAHLSYSKLGVLYTQQKEYDQAEKYLKLAISINPKDAVDRYNLGLLYLNQNKNQEALEEFLKSEELGSEDTKVLENVGEAYLSLKKYDKSIESFNKLLDINKRNVRVISRLAEIYYEKGDLEKALELYKKIITIEPATENARIAYLNMGNILDDAQRFDDAIEAYEKALTISPKDDSAYYNLGIAYKHSGKPEKAIEAWKKAGDLNPDNPAPQMAIADYYYENNHYDYAMDEYQRILRRWSNLQDGQFNLATIYYKKNQLDFAIEGYKRVIELNDKNDLARKAYINLGTLYSKVQKGEEGIDKGLNYIQKALLLKPGDAEALFSLGIMYFRKEMMQKAIDTFYQAIKSTTDNKLIADAYNNIGRCYYKLKKYRKSLQAFTRAVEEDPTNEEIRMNRKVASQAYENELERE